MGDLQILEELRTKEEVLNYFKQLGKNITEEELDALKQSYDKAQESSGALTLEQLNDVAGGYCFLEWEGHTLQLHITHEDVSKKPKGESLSFNCPFDNWLFSVDPNSKVTSSEQLKELQHSSFDFLKLDDGKLTLDFKIDLRDPFQYVSPDQAKMFATALVALHETHVHWTTSESGEKVPINCKFLRIGEDIDPDKALTAARIINFVLVNEPVRKAVADHPLGFVNNLTRYYPDVTSETGIRLIPNGKRSTDPEFEYGIEGIEYREIVEDFVKSDHK